MRSFQAKAKAASLETPRPNLRAIFEPCCFFLLWSYGSVVSVASACGSARYILSATAGMAVLELCGEALWVHWLGRTVDGRLFEALGHLGSSPRDLDLEPFARSRARPRRWRGGRQRLQRGARQVSGVRRMRWGRQGRLLALSSLCSARVCSQSPSSVVDWLYPSLPFLSIPNPSHLFLPSCLSEP